MRQLTLALSNNHVRAIVASETSHLPGLVIIGFSPAEASSSRKIDFINFCNQSFEDVRIVEACVIIIDIKNLRMITDKLIQLCEIEPGDRSTIADLNRKIDALVAQRNKLEYAVSHAQADIIMSVAEIYIDDILDQSKNDHNLTTILFCAVFATNFYRENLQQFLVQHEINVEVFASIEALWKICNGHANLESTLLRMNDNMPDLLRLRVVIENNIIKKLLEKYQKTTDVDQVYMLISLEIFCPLICPLSQNANPFRDLRPLIEAAINEKKSTEDTSRFLESGEMNGIDPFIITAFLQMQIITDTGADFDRIRAVQAHFPNSQAIANIYKHLENTWLKPKNKSKQDELQEIILENNLDSAKNFIAKNPDISDWINKFCSDGHTVFITATLSSSVEIMLLLLNAGANVNVTDIHRKFLPISIVINHSNVAKLTLMLEHNADVLFICGPRKVSPDRLYLYQREGATPLTLALDNFRENPSETNIMIVKLLLRHGAGTGYKFESIFSEILQDEVALGAIFSQGDNLRMITTVSDFILKIPETDYPHWNRVFRNLLSSPIMSQNNQFRLLVAQAYQEVQPLVPSATLSAVQISFRFHQGLERRAVHIGGDRLADFKPFFDALANRNYGKGLRCTCTIQDPVALELLELILEYKDKLTFNINETAGTDKVNALHIAATKGNTLAYNLLMANGADDSIKAGNGLIASEILENNLSKKSSSK